MMPLYLARNTQRAISALLAVFITVLAASAVMAEEQKTLKGVALVIGQSKYAHITPLPNPANDAREMSKLLTDLGFDGRAVTDRDAGKLSRDLERFVEDAEGADIAFLYYSGHGIEAGGDNYLVPVNADEASLGNAGVELVSLTAVVDKLKATVPVVIVLLDACRTNPFPATAQLKATPESPALPVTVSGLGAPRGAAVVENAAPATENLGTVIGYAAEPGRPALDGAEGGNSPYAAALLRHLSAMKGAELGSVMRMVTEEVYLSTETRQRPWVNESLRRLLYLGVAPDEPEGEDGLITGERRQLLLTIADLPSLERGQVETISKDKGVPISALYGVLSALGVKDMPKDPEALEKLLKMQAETIKRMMAERESLNVDDPEIKKLAEAAHRAIQQGAIATARQFLDDAVKRVEATAGAVDAAEEAVKNKRLADAAIYVRRAEAASLASDYLAAAKDYAKAFSLVEKWDEKLKWNYKNLEAEALNAQGDEKADNDALRQSIAAYEQLLSFIPNGEKNADWAKTRNNMGVAYLNLNERVCDRKLLEEAAQIFRGSLEVLTRQSDPVNWAAAQNNYANALIALGQRESNTFNLEAAVAAQRAVLEIRNRDKLPTEWADSQFNLGIALSALGGRESGDARLLEAVGAYRAAFVVIAREKDPLRWGNLQNSLGNTLSTLATRKNDMAMLKEAEKTLRLALEVRTRERVPLKWGNSLNGLSEVTYNIGQRSGTATTEMEEAAKGFRDALVEVTRERSAVNWATIQNNLASSLLVIGMRKQDVAMIEEAAVLFPGPIEVFKRDCSPQDWAMTRVNFGNAQQALGKIKDDPAKLTAAIALYNEAAEEFTRERDPITWAGVQAMLGSTLEALASRGGGLDMYKQSIAAKQASLSVYTKENSGLEWAEAQLNLGNSLAMVGNFEKGTESYDLALIAFNASMEVFTRDTNALKWGLAQNGIGDVYWGYGTRRQDRKAFEESITRFEMAKGALNQAGMASMAGLVDNKIKIISDTLAGMK
ncbi:peptidase C14 [Nordella sp. HKS 07]|uniref:caspase family protein n=1 Tax=Nordella sp. HKS 07 TaxID=2712222 RepID=UPI0013E1F3BE|nr:caspase domain-containing protein [Nordella sp. HKS 07]QIG50669.1 peptidase C14 [Nordella sp. HKS 07]